MNGMKYVNPVQYVVTTIDRSVVIVDNVTEETRDRKDTTMFLWDKPARRRRLIMSIKLSDVRRYSVKVY